MDHIQCIVDKYCVYAVKQKNCLGLHCYGGENEKVAKTKIDEYIRGKYMADKH